jgi:hypothetical protein
MINSPRRFPSTTTFSLLILDDEDGGVVGVLDHSFSTFEEADRVGEDLEGRTGFIVDVCPLRVEQIDASVQRWGAGEFDELL